MAAANCHARDRGQSHDGRVAAHFFLTVPRKLTPLSETVALVI
jgi:hypothetical protein